MCVIAICPPKLRPSLATLTACAEANPHGAGVAWREGNRVHWEKGFHSPAALKEFIDKLEGDIVIHFRWASVGEPTAALCHPFPIQQKASTALSGAARRVLFHNGTWGGWRDSLAELAPDLDGPISDTRVAAIRVAHLGDPELNRMSGRWVVVTAKSLDFYGDFQTRRGIRYSNLNWVRRLPEELRGAPVRIVEEHGPVAQASFDKKLSSPACAPAASASGEGEPWVSNFQLMADKTGRTIKDLDTGEVFRPRAKDKRSFDYRRWYREQQEMHDA